MDVPALLRFLTQDAKVPLATAMTKAKDLVDSKYNDYHSLETADIKILSRIFDNDDKVAKQIRNAAKRLAKKRAASTDGQVPTPAKRQRRDPFESIASIPPHEFETSLALPMCTDDADALKDHVFTTNRAPLVLAFAIALLRYTMPDQPPSSHLSLAQAVVSEGARNKAKAIGLSKTPTANDEGWAKGQPVVRVMNRDVSVLRRWGYDWSHGAADDKVESEHNEPLGEDDKSPALWAIDLEQLKTMNGPLTFATHTPDTAGLPVYSATRARDYLLRSFETTRPDIEVKDEVPKIKRTAAVAAAERFTNVGRLLRALDLLFASWAPYISATELDKRAWTWYVKVRPDVEHGVAGWGAKGQVRLADILALRRT